MNFKHLIKKTTFNLLIFIGIFCLSGGSYAVAAETYPAPVLNSATLNGGNYVLDWSLPSNPTGTPAGGYDIVIDGVDTNAQWETSNTTTTISGLDTTANHTFQIEARWTQATPRQFPRSNVLTVTPAESYPAPVLNSAAMSGSSYVLNWSLPNNPAGNPTGGYDIVVDGADTGEWRTTQTSTTISGLDTRVSHTFMVEARWTQADPSQYPRSGEITVESLKDTTPPTVIISSPSSDTTITSAQTLTVVANASDDTGVSKVEFYNGSTLIATDTSNTFSTSLTISDADNGTIYNLTAVAYDAAGNSTSSTPVNVVVNLMEAYPAPVLNSAALNGSSYALTWNLPSNSSGIPAGGYDIVVDGVDTGEWRTTQTSTTINGLDTAVNHTFMVEARWTQADPSQYPRSSALTVEAFKDSTSPAVTVTSPSSGITVTSDQTLTIVANASDDIGVSKVEFYDGANLIGTDTTNTFSTSISITDAHNGTHSITAVAYDDAGNTSQSSPVTVTVNIQSAQEATYTAPILDYVEAVGSEFHLGWSQPSTSYGIPAGGYDIIIDGQDSDNPTNQVTAIIGGQSAGSHCFQIEARWTQAEPKQFPRSEQVCATLEETSSDDSATSEPDTSEPRSDGSLAVFPGAEGFGSGTVAGRGGQIIRVTNLNDSGTGSFRAAATASGARIVVFEVGGTINLNSVVLIRNPYLTIAGQTAPEPGIQLRNYGIEIDTHDVLVQHLRIRAESGEGDGLRIHGYQNATYNIVIDHVTSNWASDENMSIWGATSGSGVHDVTLSNCMIAEGGFGILIGSSSTQANFMNKISVIDNLFAHKLRKKPETDQ